MSFPQRSARPNVPHVHVGGHVCPTCDQPIPNDKAEQVLARAKAKESEIADSVSARLRDGFAIERAQIEAALRAEIEKAKAETGEKVAAAREEGAQLERAAVAAQFEAMTKAHAEQREGSARQLAAAQDQVAKAEEARAAAENEARLTKESEQATLDARLSEQREALEKEKASALNAKDAKHFEDSLKLKEKLDEAMRKLEQKTAAELGEGAEVDLFEELKALFEGDKIRRVPKGTAGADIIHEVVENGKVCGKIVYDSKKRSVWRSDFATKLCEDKVAEGADHAVLSLLKFPAEERQLAMRDGVILANPARVAVIAEILRDEVVRIHSLRISGVEREKKKGELYSYITGERFRQHLDAIESNADKLMDIDVAEQKAHRKVWENRGSVVSLLRKTHGNLRADVARIIGTQEPERK